MSFDPSQRYDDSYVRGPEPFITMRSDSNSGKKEEFKKDISLSLEKLDSLGKELLPMHQDRLYEQKLDDWKTKIKGNIEKGDFSKRAWQSLVSKESFPIIQMAEMHQRTTVPYPLIHKAWHDASAIAGALLIVGGFVSAGAILIGIAPAALTAFSSSIFPYAIALGAGVILCGASRFRSQVLEHRLSLFYRVGLLKLVHEVVKDIKHNLQLEDRTDSKVVYETSSVETDDSYESESESGSSSDEETSVAEVTNNKKESAPPPLSLN